MRPGRKNILGCDIDNDGRLNVLVAVQNRNHFDAKILCLDDRGKPLWENRVAEQ